MHMRLIAAALVAAALAGCSAVSELPTYEEYRQAALTNQPRPDATPAEMCYMAGVPANTPEHTKCAAGVAELVALPDQGMSLSPHAACAKMAEPASPLYLHCVQARQGFEQAIDEGYRNLVSAAEYEDARRAAAWQGVAQGMHNFNMQQMQQRQAQQNRMVTCTTGPAFGGTSTTTCR